MCFLHKNVDTCGDILINNAGNRALQKTLLEFQDHSVYRTICARSHSIIEQYFETFFFYSF